MPFENLSIHLGEDVVLEDDALVDKVVGRHRGGFCYELNGAFAALLRDLGHDVELLAARAHHGDGRLGPPYDHLALRVDGTWLADVGFGRFAVEPLRLDTDGEDQADPGGTFRLVGTPEGDVDVLHDGVPQYRLELRPRQLGDFEATAWWHRTSPDSHFTQSLVCSRLTDTGRVTLSDHLLVRTVGGERTERTLETDDEVLAVYRDEFGINLPAAPSRSPR